MTNLNDDYLDAEEQDAILDYMAYEAMEDYYDGYNKGFAIMAIIHRACIIIGFAIGVLGAWLIIQ